MRAPRAGDCDLLPFAVRFLQQHAWAPQTRASLSSECKAFYAYCDLANINTFPVDGVQLTLYVTWLAMTGRVTSADSLRQYVSAVNTLHRTMGLSCPTPSQYGPLQQVITGFRRLAQRPTKKSLPVTPPILTNLLGSRPHHPLCAVQAKFLTVLRSFTLLLFQTMVRSSNMVPPNRSKIDLEMILTWDKIRRVQSGVVITIVKSKTIQYGERIQQIPLAASMTSQVCPVVTLDCLATMYGRENCGPGTPVFRLPNSTGGWAVMTKADYIPFFRARLRQMGLDESLYSLHGFRHGAIQECMLVEKNMGLVKLTSDHASDAILAYSQVPPERRMDISAKINANLGGHMFYCSSAPPLWACSAPPPSGDAPAY